MQKMNDKGKRTKDTESERCETAQSDRKDEEREREGETRQVSEKQGRKRGRGAMCCTPEP